ncbi:hypothetical protein [Donghicola tyrosinivorans]|nr:hypothetical protein [Donghicola tyrosinivorans]MEE3070370.1 hypothetical protein [Pseudomonadota bacterium]
MPEVWGLMHKLIASYGMGGLAAFWALKAGATYGVLRWWKNKKRVG